MARDRRYQTNISGTDTEINRYNFNTIAEQLLSAPATNSSQKLTNSKRRLEHRPKLGFWMVGIKLKVLGVDSC